MGPRFERRAVYVNVNRADHAGAADYPACNPRVDLDPEAWLANLRRAGVRWLHVYGYPGAALAGRVDLGRGAAAPLPPRLRRRAQPPLRGPAGERRTIAARSSANRKAVPLG